MTRWTIGAAFAATLTAAALAIAPGWRGSNFHEVLPGRVYRSAQLSRSALLRAIDTYHLRTIVNLRGPRPASAWYDTEVAVATERGLVHEDIDFSPDALPTQPALARLVDVLLHAPEPLLLHCSSGSDRTGVASAVARIVKEGAALTAARAELAFAYGHLPFGPSREIARVFDLYEGFLASRGIRESPAAFREWVGREYVPYGYRARLDPIALPHLASAGAPVRVRVRITNTSPEPWIPGSRLGFGIKLGVRLLVDRRWTDFDRAALPRVVQPGESTDVDHLLLAPATPGEHRLKLDMVDEHVTWFEDQGSTPLVVALAVIDRVGGGR